MSTTLALPDELTIYSVAETAVAWRTHLDDSGEALVLDAAGLAEVDAAGVQLLVSLANALQQRGRALVLKAPPELLTVACTRLGAGFLLDAAPTPEAAA